MPRRKKEDVERDTLFVSLHFAVDRAMKTLMLHAAYTPLVDDLRNLIKLSQPHVAAYMSKRALVSGTTDTEH